MQDFQENRCRLCLKTFCCKECRYQHEEQFHEVNPECEICIYGRATVKNASVQLLTHIKNTHWPVHCVFCKKVFTTLDDLIPHEKCPLKQDYLKLQTTPKTPVNAEELFAGVTPFYKSLGVAQEIGGSLTAMVMTSTPKEELNKNEKITPINQSQICCPYKSSLKLTESSNFSDSKKSERRVTFSETPSVSENKKPKCLPLIKQMLHEESETFSTDDSSTSLEEFKTAPTAPVEEKENIDNEIMNLDKWNSTIWESALTKLDASSITEPIRSNQINISVQINVANSTPQSDSSEYVSSSHQSISLWSSMTNMVKSVVSNLSTTAQNSFSSVSMKRLPENDAEVPSVKRIKLTDLRCRRPLRDTGQPCTVRLIKPRFLDKATQTDERWM